MAKVQVIDRPDRWDERFSGERLPAQLVAKLLALPLFRLLNPQDFPEDLKPADILANDCRIRGYARGETIYAASSHQTSLFVVAKGGVRMRSQQTGQDPTKRRTPSGIGSLFRRPLRNTRQRLERLRSNGKAAVEPDEVLGPNSVFGEIEALTRTARHTTAVADMDDTVLLEIRWPGTRELLHWSDAFRAHVEGLYRARSIELGLRRSTFFAGEDAALIRGIAKQCFFDTHGSFDWTHAYQRQRAEQPNGASMAEIEPVIVEHDQYLEDVFLINSGFARLTEQTETGEKAVGFMKAGDTFGVGELRRSLKDGGPALATYGLRAVGYADVIRIPAHFVEGSLAGSEGDLEPAARPARCGGTHLSQPLLDFVVDNRFINGAKAMVIDTTRCVNCDDCVRACAATHDNVTRLLRQGISHGKFLIANACMHCTDPVCLIDCPTGAIARDDETGNVVIDEKTCIGCASCESACPYNNIRMIDAMNSAGQLLVDKEGAHIRTAVKCDLCTGRSGGPACLRACPHDTMKRIDLSEPQTLSDWL